ncbi:conserved phage C-terminal domain-containing protein [Neptuniibacter sp.]|uniref:conserved phage C-terminal domain-containing protein n=1 Tax=Neptuniibacter sp. TaxID=1962643 RepID=UPI00262E6292|nr:conserved phage C-terminal domain-containing protein [Neptuniibacter sp.]MCP4597037.1 hypothetical protein [Neptuniibacter sp.]
MQWPIFRSEKSMAIPLNSQVKVAKKVLAYLNERKGSGYENYSFILARIKSGRTYDDCVKVIETKMQDDFFIKNPRNLNPETLFRPGNFDRYVNETTGSFGREPSKKQGKTQKICDKCRAQFINGKCECDLLSPEELAAGRKRLIEILGGVGKSIEWE